MIKNFLKENIAIKIISIVCGVVLWAYVNSVINTTSTFIIPIRYINTPSQLDVFQNEGIDKIEVHLMGRRKDILQIKKENLVINVNLLGSKEGVKHILLHRNELGIPENLEVVKILPQTFSVFLKPKSQNTATGK